jgi:predicted RNA-binding Zn ribbon-like protein
MATSTRDMPLNGGHPALDFVNTVDSRRGRWGPDLLRCCDDLIVLAARVGLIDEKQVVILDQLAKKRPQQAGTLVEEAISLREAIYDLFVVEDTNQPYPDKPFAVIHERARRARARQRLFETKEGFQWLQPISELTDLVDLFAWQASELLIRRHERRPVRECKGDNCGWLFLDTSKGGRRLWCSNATCGTHARVKRFRRKAAPQN